MAVTSTDQKDKKINGGDNKEDCQKDQSKMPDTSTDQNGKVSNTAKEEKIGTCHQCRQKIKGLSVSCNNKKKDKTCRNKFCHRCLWNRYGEQAEEKSVLEDWNCPKCRGICNCSICMKRRGHQPTGILVHTAKATGFSSVSDMLRVNGPKALVPNKCSKVAYEGHENNDASDNKPSDGSSSKAEKENSISIDLNLIPVPSSPDERKKKKMRRMEPNDLEEISLPRGTELINVVGINLPQEDVGHALQFLEFCSAFKEILDLKEGESEYILLELIRGGNGCRGKQSPVIRFHIVLLSLIQKDFENGSPVFSYKSGKSSWLHALKNCASKSQDLSEKLKLDDSNSEADEYESLGSSTRLRLLCFLCDEVLYTVKMRNWIDDQNLKFAERLKVLKERVQAAKQKENQLKLKMQDEVAKAIIANNGTHLSPSAQEVVVSEIKSEVDQARAEVLEAKNMVSYEEQSCDAARTEPLISDINGRIYWRLKGYSDDSNLFLQDVGSWDGTVCSEKWYTLDAEQVKEVEHIRSLRKRKATQRWVFT